MSFSRSIAKARPTLVFILFSVITVACSKQDAKKLGERGRIEGGAQADAQLASDREAARLMEIDLANRFDFYEAHSGHFEGPLTGGSGKYRIRISLFPNPAVSRYSGSRKRSQEEVQNDLSRLAFNVHITQWDPSVEGSYVGCRVEDLRPDLKTGVLNIIKETCPGSYFLVLNRTSVDGSTQTSSGRRLNIQADRAENGASR